MASRTAGPLIPRAIFGLDTSVSSPLGMLDKNLLVYPVGPYLVLDPTLHPSRPGTSTNSHNTSQPEALIPQQLLAGSDDAKGYSALTVSSCRTLLAVSEWGALTRAATVTVYEVKSRTVVQNLSATDVSDATNITILAFSPDAMYLVGLTGSPDMEVIVWQMATGKCVSSLNITSMINSSITALSFSPLEK